MKKAFTTLWGFLKLGLYDNPLSVARSRAVLCIVGIGVLYVGLAASLMDVTVFSSSVFDDSGQAKHIIQNRNRADIYDRNNQLLAKNLSVVSLVADPASLLDVDEAIEKTLTVFPDLDKARLQKLLNRKKSRYAMVKHGITPKQQAAINNLGIPGFYFEPYLRRIYPQGNLFSHVLGFVGNNSEGLQGLERTFDNMKGGAVSLSLDARAQFIMYEELHKSIRKHRALGGSGIIMNAKTREILAMVSLPDFNPHSNPNEIVRATMFNRATQGIYEFGSSLKVFNSALSLQSGKSLTQDIYDATEPLPVGGGFTVTDYHAQKRPLNIAEVFIHSSNIGSALMAWESGGESQKQFFKDLGLLNRINTEYPEIVTPQYPKRWKKIAVATMSYGHGISISPLHLVNAVATVIGDGKHKDPQFVLQEGRAANDGQAILNSQTILQMRGLFRLNVLQGSGSSANIPGYRVGGKTGTAEKLNDDRTGYDKDKLISNFVAAFPIEEPEYVIFVMLDEPKANGVVRPTGGAVAAPVVGQVIRRLAPALGMLPQIQKEKLQDERLYLPLLQLHHRAPKPKPEA